MVYPQRQVFEVICRETNECFVYAIPDRMKKTLLVGEVTMMYLCKRFTHQTVNCFTRLQHMQTWSEKTESQGHIPCDLDRFWCTTVYRDLRYLRYAIYANSSIANVTSTAISSIKFCRISSCFGRSTVNVRKTQFWWFNNIEEIRSHFRNKTDSFKQTTYTNISVRTNIKVRAHAQRIQTY